MFISLLLPILNSIFLILVSLFIQLSYSTFSINFNKFIKFLWNSVLRNKCLLGLIKFLEWSYIKFMLLKLLVNNILIYFLILIIRVYQTLIILYFLFISNFIYNNLLWELFFIVMFISGGFVYPLLLLLVGSTPSLIHSNLYPILIMLFSIAFAIGVALATCLPPHITIALLLNATTCTQILIGLLSIDLLTFGLVVNLGMMFLARIYKSKALQILKKISIIFLLNSFITLGFLIFFNFSFIYVIIAILVLILDLIIKWALYKWARRRIDEHYSR